MPYADMAYVTAAALLIPAALWSLAVWLVAAKIN